MERILPEWPTRLYSYMKKPSQANVVELSGRLLLAHGVGLLHRLVEARAVDGVAVDDVVLARGVDDIVVLLVTPCLAYRGYGVHGRARVEGDDAVAGGGLEHVHSVIVGDGHQEALLELRGRASRYLIEGERVHAAGVADELLHEHGTHDVRGQVVNLWVIHAHLTYANAILRARNGHQRGLRVHRHMGDTVVLHSIPADTTTLKRGTLHLRSSFTTTCSVSVSVNPFRISSREVYAKHILTRVPEPDCRPSSPPPARSRAG